MVLLVLFFFGARTVEAVRLQTPPVIDGVLDEPCWYDNPGIADFVEHYPDMNTEASESTRIVIVYDDYAIYFGCFCYYNEPDQVVARLVPREATGDGDDITICLDTYNDDRNAYIFAISALDNQRDIHATQGGGYQDWSWNGVWYNKASIEEYGWFAEIAIPWKTLRFPPIEEQVWGISISRWMDKKYEKLMWADYLPGDVSGACNVSRFGELTGIRGVQSGLHLEFLPHLTQTLRLDGPELFDSVSLVPLKNGVAGLDIKWAASSNLIIDVTALPDYGQIEADPEQINLSEFETYLNERRPFFTEGLDMFHFPFFSPVYTRRIGRKLPDGSEVPIYAGAKATGKLGGTELGILEAYTARAIYAYTDEYGQEVEDTVPAYLYSLGRLNQDIFSRSKIGFIATSREGFGETAGGERVAGTDLKLVFPGEWRVIVGGLHTFYSDALRQGGPIGVFSFSKSGKWNFWTEFTYSDSLADLNAVGYLDRPGKLWSELGGGYINFWGEGLIRKANLNIGVNPEKYLGDSTLTCSAWTWNQITFSNYWFVEPSACVSRRYFYEDTSIRWTKSADLGFQSNTTKEIYGGLWLSVLDQYVY
jgi:hypothetical protein